MARNHTLPAPADAPATALPVPTVPATPPVPAGPQLIVAIGASAGGLEAYKRFFTHMPAESGMAFVLVQHLAPDRHSMLAELIGRSTRMEVVQAADGDPVQPGHVYVIPPDATLTIESGTLQVQSPAPPRQHRWPIDTFFSSLAEDQGDNAVCVVLSGSGSDGARGLRTVKEYGGLTVAQAVGDHTPMSGMPASAAATGLVDHVLPVEQIPALLIAHLAHLRATRDRKAPDGIRQDLPAHVQTITALLRAEVGHDFGQYKQKTLVRRIQRRMQVLQLDAVTDYIARLRKDPIESEALFRDLLIGVTEFFRDSVAFEALKSRALPALLAEKGAADTLRIWVPACSTGEEAYSMAIAIRESIGDRRAAPKVQIFATDIDDRAIATARAGRYAGPLMGVTPEREALWFTTDGEDRCVTKAIREMCVFSVHSAIKDPPFSQLDIVSCRNLLIYLNAELQQRLLRVFHYALRPSGYLLLGPSESLARSASFFTVLDKTQRLYQRRNGTLPIGVPAFSSPAGIAHPGTAASRSATARTRARVDDALDGRVRRALEKFSPAYVVIDGNHDIVRFSGNTARYLGPTTGSASLNLFSLLHKGLRSAARASLQQASLQQRVVVQEGLGIDVEGQRQALRLIVAPLQEADGGKDLYVVAFDDTEQAQAGAQAGGGETESARVTALEQDLEQTHQQLQAAIEQQETANEDLMSANEEYQSVNEELQTANEELETSKEEMQSINEELQTINAELQSKNDALARLNNDLRNLMESTQIATLFLDTALHVTGFTSGMGEVFHLREADRGRPITDIATRVHYPQLQDDVQQVMRTLAPVERELHGGNGVPSFLLRVRPYRTVDNVIDGAVLTFIDITEREAQESERARLAAIVEWSKDAIIGYALDGTVTSWNAGAERVLGHQPRTVIGQSLAMLLPAGQDDRFPQLLAACADPEGVTKFEATWRRQNGSTVAIDLSFSPVKDASGQVVSGSAIARDVTDRRRTDRALHDSEFRLAAILEQTSMGLAQTNVEGRFELVNPRFCEIVGRTARELYRLRVQDILHREDVQQSLDLVRTLLAERNHLQLDVRFVRPDGSIVWTSNSVTAMRGGDHAPRHIISAVLDITEQKLASQHVDLMLDELNHRVKNTLATVQAIAMQTLTQSTSMEAFRAAFGARLLALSNTHNLLAHDAWTGAQLRDIIASELAPYLRDQDSADQGRARLAGGDLLLNPKMALALSMAIHELATNASKYGALSGEQGDVTVRWHARDEDGQPWLHLSWTESGGPAVTQPTRRGFGTRLITEGLAFELNGEATLDYVETGVSCVIHVPLSEAAP